MAASQQGVVDLDLASGALSLSGQGAAIFGFQPAPLELKTSAWSNRIMPEDWEFLHQTLGDYRNHPETPFRVEFRIQTNSGQRWCELRAIVTGRTESMRCFGLIADITVRKSSERQTRPRAGAITD